MSKLQYYALQYTGNRLLTPTLLNVWLGNFPNIKVLNTYNYDHFDVRVCKVKMILQLDASLQFHAIVLPLAKKIRPSWFRFLLTFALSTFEWEKLLETMDYSRSYLTA